MDLSSKCFGSMDEASMPIYIIIRGNYNNWSVNLANWQLRFCYIYTSKKVEVLIKIKIPPKSEYICQIKQPHYHDHNSEKIFPYFFNIKVCISQNGSVGRRPSAAEEGVVCLICPPFWELSKNILMGDWLNIV